MIYNLKDSNKKIAVPKDIFEICTGILKADDRYDRDKEHVWVFQLDNRNRIKLIELVTLGTLNSSLIHPREVFRRAVHEGSASIILAHNHPSGDSSPSEQDIEITRKLRDAGKILEIELIDHVIIGNDNFYSLKEKGVVFS